MSRTSDVVNDPNSQRLFLHRIQRRSILESEVASDLGNY